MGSVVGQIGKIYGCRVVGIAGGPDKCRHVVENLGFDACIDYKADDFYGQLKAASPKGIDIYFENVGGFVFDSVLRRMNRFGRIPVCGMIAIYNATEPPPGPQNLASILVNRIKMQGFIVFDYAKRYKQAAVDLAKWHAQKKLVLYDDIRAGGIESFVDTLNALYSGKKLGKLILRIGD